MNKQEFLTKINECNDYSIKVMYDDNKELVKAFVNRILFKEGSTSRLEPGRCIYFNNKDYDDCFDQIKHYMDMDQISRNPLNRIAVFSELECGISVFKFCTEEDIKATAKSMFELIEKMICVNPLMKEPVNPIPDLSVVPESLVRTAEQMIEGYKHSLKYYEQVQSEIEMYKLARDGNTIDKLRFLFDGQFEDILYDNSKVRIAIDYFSE